MKINKEFIKNLKKIDALSKINKAFKSSLSLNEMLDIYKRLMSGETIELNK